MTTQQDQSLDDALAYLERVDPRVAAAKQRLDDAMASIVTRGRIQPEIDAAKRLAMLDLVHEKYASCDQKGLDSLLITLAFRGYEITEQDLLGQLQRCSPDVQNWWMEPCGCTEVYDGRGTHTHS